MRSHTGSIFVYTLVITVYFSAVLCSENADQENHVDFVPNKGCQRKCDTHFSDSKCWRKSFHYFSNQLIYDVVNYLNTLGIVGSDGKPGYENKALKEFQDETFNSFIQPFKKNRVSKNFTQIMTDLIQFMQNHDIIEHPSTFNEMLMCPEENKPSCRTDNQYAILKYQTLTIFVACVNLVVIFVFVYYFLLIEKKLVKANKQE